jgi:hypothetical protein
MVTHKYYDIYMAYPFLGKPLAEFDGSRKALCRVSNSVNWSNVHGLAALMG